MSTTLRDSTLSSMEHKRQKILNGEVNCIPTPFPRFKNDFAGLEQAQYLCVTSFTKGGKSQFVSFAFIYQTIMFAYNSKKPVNFKIFYFPLEETKERIIQRFMSWLLFVRDKIRISPRELRSTVDACPKAVIDRLKQPDMMKILEFFENHIIFPEEQPNPTGIYKYLKQYAENNGKVYTHTIKYKDDFGVEQEKQVFDRYEMNDPNEYRIVIIDTINLIDCERGMTLKQSMDKLSEYSAKYLRNRYFYTMIMIQQQAFESESNEAFKMGKVRPSVAGLGDSKYISRDKG